MELELVREWTDGDTRNAIYKAIPTSIPYQCSTCDQTFYLYKGNPNYNKASYEAYSSSYPCIKDTHNMIKFCRK